MNPLVTASWVAEHLSDPLTVILDATLPPVGIVPQIDTHARYLAEHIPGAVFFDIDKLSDQSTELPHMLPTPEAFSRSMSTLGVSDEMSIVIYEQNGVFSAPRAWWMLRTFGAQNVYILDGGLRAWMESNLPTQAGETERKPTDFHSKLNRNAVKGFTEIRQMIAERAQILDARSSGRFTGDLPEPRSGISSGHMPGATNVPFTDLVDDGRLKSAAKLREYFVAEGVDLNRPITTTCGSGVTAAVVLVGLEIAGARQVSLYDGSWTEYAQHPEAVIEKDARRLSSTGS